jgi:two-component system cell cycle response regulator
MRVLIAEDDVTSRSILQAVMGKWGYDVVTASDGETALKLLQQPDAPKMALLDWMMPAMDGIELCRRVRAVETADPPYLILLTARGEKADIVAGLGAGADDYIAKPYNNAELQARLGVGQRVLALQERLRRALADAEQLALTDALTGIPNRRAIMARLQSEMARGGREKAALWVSILDLDHFKIVNDTFGHSAGDMVLCECAQRIAGVIRPYDAVGRFGGEEFLLVLSTPGTAIFKDAFERVRGVVAARPFLAGQTEVTVTVSQGVAQWNGAETAAELIRRADEALYRAKENGRNRIEYTPQAPGE